MLRKHIQDSGFLETGVHNIVDQVVGPKIQQTNPEVENILYTMFGMEKPDSNDEEGVPRPSPPASDRSPLIDEVPRSSPPASDRSPLNDEVPRSSPPASVIDPAASSTTSSDTSPAPSTSGVAKIKTNTIRPPFNLKIKLEIKEEIKVEVKTEISDGFSIEEQSALEIVEYLPMPKKQKLAK